MRIELAASRGYSLRAVIASHGWSRLLPFRTNEGQTELWYVDAQAGGPLSWKVVQPGGRGAVILSVAGRLAPAALSETTLRARWVLGLDQRLTGFYRICRSEPKLAHVPRLGQGRFLRSATVFEDVVKTILTTNVTWSGTVAMVRSLVAHYGEPAGGDDARRGPAAGARGGRRPTSRNADSNAGSGDGPDGGRRRAFPTPERLARVREETLRRRARLGYRAPYVRALARRVADGAVDLERLKSPQLSAEECREVLSSINGVGPYATSSLMMLLGHYDSVPVDSWALTLVSHEWYGGAKITAKEVLKRFEPWGEHRALAYWFRDWVYLHRS